MFFPFFVASRATVISQHAVPACGCSISVGGGLNGPNRAKRRQHAPSLARFVASGVGFPHPVFGGKFFQTWQFLIKVQPYEKNGPVFFQTTLDLELLYIFISYSLINH